MHDFETALGSLEFALRIQSSDVLMESISSLDANSKMQAARIIMKSLLGSSGAFDHVEFCISFLRSILSLMTRYVSELILERVVKVKRSSRDAEMLSRRNECANLLLINASETVNELDECGRYLMYLRQLQSDMNRLDYINAGVKHPSAIMTRSGSLTISTFPEDSAMESVVERSLLIANACSGMFWLSMRFENFSAVQLRATARLIAYCFITSPSLDSFFAGVHILRNSGHNVESILKSFYEETSIKFIRDRIGGHLAHSGFEAKKELNILEQLYSNNCYWTELNRAWCRASVPHGGQGRVASMSPASVSSLRIECGNVPDIPDSLDRPQTGQQLSQEESLSVLKCNACIDLSRPTASCGQSARGYLNITGSWIDKMTQREIERIVMESPDGGKTIDLEYAVLHKDWKSILELPSSTIGPRDSGKFLNRLFLERDDLSGPYVRRHELARLKRLFTGEARDGNVNVFEILRWFLVGKDLPQLALLYMRRFGLGSTEEAVHELCYNVGSKIEFMARGRLGNVVQVPQDPMECLAVWATTNTEESRNLIADIPGISPLLLPNEPIVDDPVFANAFDIKSKKEDVIIVDLLNDLFTDLNLSSVTDRVPVGISETRLLDKIEYLTCQGRPSLAFSLGGESILTLQKAARRVAFYNIFDNGVVASAVALLDLFGESTEKLRVDVQCARTIGNSQQVRDMFLSFDDKGQSQLLSALKLLEESAWSKEPPLETPPAAATTGGLESPWHLVALFCRVHNLPRSLTLLHELARNGDWVMFLHESDLQQCPIETVRDVVQLYFGNPLRSHLNILLDVCPAKDDHLRRRPVYSNDATNDHTAQFEKALALFKFEKAKYHYEFLSEEEQESVREHCHIPGVEFEIDRWTCKPLSDCQIHLSPETIQETCRGDAPENQETSSPFTKVDPEEIKQAVTLRQFHRISSCVDTPTAVRSIAESIVTEPQVIAEWGDADYDEFIGIISFDLLELFGDILRECDTELGEFRANLDYLTYIAYLNAFVDEDKFESFIRDSKSLGASLSSEICTVDPETNLDNLFRATANMIDDDTDKLSLFQAAVAISQRYQENGFHRKHLDANVLALSVCERFRQRSEVL
jgi:hypothetical protein